MAAAGMKKLECKDLHGYLKTLGASLLDELYGRPATCLAVFRELTDLAKHYVMRLLFLEQAVPQAVVGSWVVSGNHGEHLRAVSQLSDLRVWHEHQISGGLAGWILSPTFRANLRTALLGGGKPWFSVVQLPPDKHAKDVAALDTYSLERWEVLLNFIVGSGEAQVSKDIMEILIKSGLMKSEEGSLHPTITPAGFQFLLMDTPSQVWYIILQYLDTMQSRGLNLVEALQFLFQISFSTLGKDYPTEGMSDSMQQFLQHLRELGLVNQRKRKSGRFYPTRLAIHLASGISDVEKDFHKEGYLVCESNYRIYAYTDSELQVALIGLFSEILYRFPNLVVANLTRDSVQEAVVRGITSEQILHFLRVNAHPKALHRVPIVPPTISDQIRLWELERDRLTFTEGVLYNQFLSQPDFEMLRNYAKDLGVLLWENNSKRHMVVSKAGHDDVKRYWKTIRKGNS
ncbi:general transcription factor IIH subunit 4-like [Branchiostoma lanceolatum]|uniref:general transcription factor IIH subunit 4-like n=1 Tax=Branchiostoma lanceolatum TaxID=7740 RepID=UPI003452CB8B